MRSRHSQLLGTSFQPAPPRLSPPALDLSPPAPAQLSHRAQDAETRRRGPVIELIAGAPTLIKSRKQTEGPKCYIVSAEQESSAISDTEETPRDIVIPYNVRRARSSARARQRVDADPVLNQPQAQSDPTPAAEATAGTEETQQLVPAQPVIWDATRHVG